MVLIEKRSLKKNLTLGVLLIIILVAAFILLQRYFAAPEQSSTNTNINGSLFGQYPIVQTFGEDIFESQQYQDLKEYGNLPVEEGKKGRINPFTPPRN
jgi:hypothetical protein